MRILKGLWAALKWILRVLGYITQALGLAMLLGAMLVCGYLEGVPVFSMLLGILAFLAVVLLIEYGAHTHTRLRDLERRLEETVAAVIHHKPEPETDPGL
jgi:predicted RND superfamily exporter protein